MARRLGEGEIFRVELAADTGRWAFESPVSIEGAHVTVSPLTFYESKTESPPIAVVWDFSLSFGSNEYKLTRACSCGTLLSAHFGFKEAIEQSRVAGYIICPDCTINWYYEVPLTFVFREV